MTRLELINRLQEAWLEGVSTDHLLDLADLLEKEGYDSYAAWFREHTWGGRHTAKPTHCWPLTQVLQRLRRESPRE